MCKWLHILCILALLGCYILSHVLLFHEHYKVLCSIWQCRDCYIIHGVSCNVLIGDGWYVANTVHNQLWIMCSSLDNAGNKFSDIAISYNFVQPTPSYTLRYEPQCLICFYWFYLNRCPSFGSQTVLYMCRMQYRITLYGICLVSYVFDVQPCMLPH